MVVMPHLYGWQDASSFYTVLCDMHITITVRLPHVLKLGLGIALESAW